MSSSILYPGGILYTVGQPSTIDGTCISPILLAEVLAIKDVSIDRYRKEEVAMGSEVGPMRVARTRFKSHRATGSLINRNTLTRPFRNLILGMTHQLHAERSHSENFYLPK